MKFILQEGILLFWGCWFSLVFFSDLFNCLQEKNCLPKDFIFNSKNFDLLTRSLSVYHIDSHSLRIFLFGIITGWAGLTACSFFAGCFLPPTINAIFINFAFVSSLSMSAAFMLAHEVFMQYELEHTLINRFSLQLLTLLVFYKI